MEETRKNLQELDYILCKRLCEEIGMNLKAESIENEYTEMIITIPRNKK